MFLSQKHAGRVSGWSAKSACGPNRQSPSADIVRITYCENIFLVLSTY